MREGLVKCKVKNLRKQSITVELLTFIMQDLATNKDQQGFASTLYCKFISYKSFINVS